MPLMCVDSRTHNWCYAVVCCLCSRCKQWWTVNCVAASLWQQDAGGIWDRHLVLIVAGSAAANICLYIGPTRVLPCFLSSP